MVEVEASRVSRTKLVQKSPCRCNLMAQNCIQQWHSTVPARMVILCLALWLNQPSRQRPENVSRYSENVPLGFVRSSLGHSSSGSFSNIGLRGAKKTLCLPCLLVLPPATSPDLRIEVQSKELPHEFFQIVWNSEVTPQFRRYQFATCVSLNGTHIQ